MWHFEPNNRAVPGRNRNACRKWLSTFQTTRGWCPPHSNCSEFIVPASKACSNCPFNTKEWGLQLVTVFLTCKLAITVISRSGQRTYRCRTVVQYLPWARLTVPSLALPPSAKKLITTENIGKKKACARTHDLWVWARLQQLQSQASTWFPSQCAHGSCNTTQYEGKVSSYQLSMLLVLNNGNVSSAHRLSMLILDVTSLLWTISGQSESKPMTLQILKYHPHMHSPDKNRLTLNISSVSIIFCVTVTMMYI